MTHLGQNRKQLTSNRSFRSAPKAAVRRALAEWVKSTQNGRSPDLLDNFVGARQHRLRHSEAQRLGGPEVDDQLEGCRLLDRQIGGLGAREDLSP